MGRKEKFLNNVLNANFSELKDYKCPIITAQDIRDLDLFNEVKNFFTKLGGIEDKIKIHHGNWDIVKEGFVIELDEERHFNRYRLITLYSKFYSIVKYSWYRNYIDFCINYENKCINAASYGGNWTNDSCEKMFGKSSLPRDFTGNGSARWKQRAFYDYLKDINAYLNNFKIIRISIWDTFDFQGNNYLLKKVLEKQMSNILAYYIKSKLTKENII